MSLLQEPNTTAFLTTEEHESKENRPDNGNHSNGNSKTSEPLQPMEKTPSFSAAEQPRQTEISKSIGDKQPPQQQQPVDDVDDTLPLPTIQDNDDVLDMNIPNIPRSNAPPSVETMAGREEATEPPVSNMMMLTRTGTARIQLSAGSKRTEVCLTPEQQEFMTDLHPPQIIGTKVEEFEQTVLLICYNRCPQVADTMAGYVTHYCVQCDHGLCTECVRRVHDAEGSPFRDHTPYSTRMSCSFEDCVHHAMLKCFACDVTKPEGVLYCGEHATMVHGGSHFQFHVTDQKCVFMTLKDQFKPEIQQHDNDDDDENNIVCTTTITDDLGFDPHDDQQQPHEPDENFIRERKRHHQRLHAQRSDSSTVDTMSDCSSSSEDDENDAQSEQEIVPNPRKAGPSGATQTTKAAKTSKAAANATITHLKSRGPKRVNKGETQPPKKTRMRHPLQRNLMHLELDRASMNSTEDPLVDAAIHSLDLHCQQISHSCTSSDFSEIGTQLANLLLNLGTFASRDSLFDKRTDITTPLVAEYINALIIKNAAGVKMKKGKAPRWLDDLPHQICNTLGNACSFEYRVCNIENIMDPNVQLDEDTETLCICFVGVDAICHMAGILMKQIMRITQMIYDQIRLYKKSVEEDGFEPQALLIAEKGIANSLLAYIHNKYQDHLKSRLGSQIVQHINSTAGVTMMRVATSKFNIKLNLSEPSSIADHWKSVYEYATKYVADRVLSMDAVALAQLQASSFETELDCQYKLGDFEVSFLRSRLEGGASGDDDGIDPELTNTTGPQTATRKKRGRPLGSGNTAKANARSKKKSKIIKPVKSVKKRKTTHEKECEDDEKVSFEDDVEAEAPGDEAEANEGEHATKLDNQEAEKEETVALTALTQPICASVVREKTPKTDDEVCYEEEDDEDQEEENQEEKVISPKHPEDEKEQGEITENK